MTPYKFGIQMVAPPTLEKQLEVIEAIRNLAARKQVDPAFRQADDLAAIRSDFEKLRRDWEELAQNIQKTTDEWLQLARSRLRKYSPDQPRVPVGNPHGGQWTREKTDATGATSQVVADPAYSFSPILESNQDIEEPQRINDDPLVASDVTPDGWIPGAQHAANWPHHYVPLATFEKFPLQDATRQVFVEATSGPLADTRVNRWSREHKAYNDAVDEAFRSYLQANNISAEQMTPAQADEFIGEIFYSKDPRIRSFNRRIWSEAFRYWRRSGGRGGDPD